jgi:chorismate mutase
MTDNDTADGSAKSVFGSGADEIDFDELQLDNLRLDELRQEIRTIDREIVELIAQRTYVAESIAAVKRDRNLPTTDDAQEERVMERAATNAEQFNVDANLVKAVFRLLIRLNKIEQQDRR